MPKCDRCGIPIHNEEIKPDLIFEVPFWKQNICLGHTFDKTPQCNICERYQKMEERYIKLRDARILCRDCHSTAIFKDDALKSLQNYLRHFFKKNNVKFHNDIPIFLVDKNDIDNLEPEQLDLSKLTIGRAIKHRPNLFVHTVTSCKPEGSGDESGEGDGSYGFSFLMAYRDYKHFLPEIEKGICKAVAYEYLIDTKNDPIGNAHKFVKKLREFREWKFKQQHSEIYGGGFIGARTAIEKFGVKNALKQIYKKTNKGRIKATMIMEEDLELDEYDYYQLISTKYD
ncbi:hypothetical protein Dsin_026886 [Dipteronia sinensis]|uniref:Uncharacterized protein n=1 Tax=Dipteronia sinensis TaxID=43782 RepID=A0AAD9ZZ35_9ROSI|nr:hypothetical protein Dsin_026886 [Dipteronia sinensis]